jgi:hypothetical protein
MFHHLFSQFFKMRLLKTRKIKLRVIFWLSMAKRSEYPKNTVCQSLEYLSQYIVNHNRFYVFSRKTL